MNVGNPPYCAVASMFTLTLQRVTTESIPGYVRDYIEPFDLEQVPLPCDDENHHVRSGFLYKHIPYLHQACGRGDLGVARVLVACGAKLDRREDKAHGFTPFEWACFTSQAHIVEWLLTLPQVVATLNERNPAHPFSTPLGLAAGNDNAETIALLLEHGADVLQQSQPEKDLPSEIARKRCEIARKRCDIAHCEYDGYSTPDEMGLDDDCLLMLERAERTSRVLELGEWRPRIHVQFPLRFRLAMRTLVILGRARKKAPKSERKQQHMCYPRAQLCSLPEELLQMLLMWVASTAPTSDVWTKHAHRAHI